MMTKQFRDARTVSVPLVAISTADQIASLTALGLSLTKDELLVRWDMVRGAVALIPDTGANDVKPDYAARGGKLLYKAFDVSDPQDLRASTMMLHEVLANPLIASTKDMVFAVMNAQRLLDDDRAVQALVNLRDAFSQQGSTIVLLGPGFEFPPELGTDILTINEPLPDTAAIASIVSELLEDAKVIEADDKAIQRAAEALTGLSTFAVEQATSLSLTGGTFDLDELWERKRQMINATNGLSVWRGGERFKDIGGVENVKSYLLHVMKGPGAPNVVVFIDEIEKAIGTDADTSGVSQSMLGKMLSWMQDTQAAGVVMIGPPGAAKSAVAKATGNEAGVPTIQFDLSGMKGSLVGESERNLGQALKVVDAVGQGKVLVLATCNKLTNLPPELRRRFKLGTFFFDLPNAEERKMIWPLYIKLFDLPNGTFTFDDDGWTGAEIRQCCEVAWRLGCSLDEASKFVVPVSISAKKDIDRLREEASNRFISASYSGIYQSNRSSTDDDKPLRRKITTSN